MKFSKTDTMAVKGIAILLMFFHHNFFKWDRFDTYTIISAPFSDAAIVMLGQFCKICVGIFAFLSAYGMTISFKNRSQEYDLPARDSWYLTVSRYISLMSGYIFVFVLVMLFSLWKDPARIVSKYGFGEKGIIEASGKFLFDLLGISDLMGTPKYIPTWWYMSLAVVLIFLMPLLLRFYKKFGVGSLLMAAVLPRTFGFGDTKFIRWFLVIMLGIWMADQDVLVKLKQFSIGKNPYVSKAVKFILCTAVLYCTVRVRQSAFWEDYLDIFDGFVCVFVIYYSYEFIIGLPVLRPVLTFLGKHSMNMFLTHTFLRSIWYGEFIYSFKYVPCIMLVLTVCSLMVSIVIEALKKVLHYQVLVNYIKNKSHELICGTETLN